MADKEKKASKKKPKEKIEDNVPQEGTDESTLKKEGKLKRIINWIAAA